jgi:hypothetical protein
MLCKLKNDYMAVTNYYHRAVPLPKGLQVEALPRTTVSGGIKLREVSFEFNDVTHFAWIPDACLEDVK